MVADPSRKKSPSSNFVAACRGGMQVGVYRNAKWPHRPSQLEQFHGRAGREGLQDSSRHRVNMGDRAS
jgi:hypothetical protein